MVIKFCVPVFQGEQSVMEPDHNVLCRANLNLEESVDANVILLQIVSPSDWSKNCNFQLCSLHNHNYLTVQGKSRMLG